MTGIFSILTSPLTMIPLLPRTFPTLLWVTLLCVDVALGQAKGGQLWARAVTQTQPYSWPGNVNNHLALLDWHTATVSLTPFYVVALMLCACCKCLLPPPHQRKFYKAVMAFSTLGELFSRLVQPTFEMAAVLNCLMLICIILVVVELQLLQMFSPGGCRSSMCEKRSKKNRQKESQRSASLSSPSHTIPKPCPDAPLTTCVPESTPQLVSSVATFSLLKDFCPEYCEKRAAAVRPPVSFRPKYDMVSQISKASVLSPILSEESLPDTPF